MKGELLNTNDSVIGIAKCCNGNLGVVIKMTPYPSDMVDLKNSGLDGIQYKIVGRKIFNVIYTTKYNGKIVEGLNALSTNGANSL